MFEFEKIDYDKIDLGEYMSYSRKPVFTTIPWMNFVIEDSKTEPAIFRVTDKDGFVGYVPMMFVKKFGIKIAGSPFRGWSTCWMGIEVEDVDKKIPIIKEIIPVLFKKYGVMYCEITDRDIPKKDIVSANIKHYPFETLELEIDKTDAELFKIFKTDARNFIRQFERRGAVLTVAEPDDEFAEEYYSELIDVFAKQNMKPTYSCDKVKRILRNNRENPDGILCLRVRTPEGKPVATSIYFSDKSKFYFWGGASFREHQHYRPNEYMLWYAIKHFRDKGIKTFDMVGDRQYKRKFGSEQKVYYTMQFAKHKILFSFRDMAERLYFKALSKRNRE